MKSKSIKITRGLLSWMALSAVLIAAGFLVDGSTEVGHHAFLIAGGICIGAGGMREWRR